MDQSDHWPSSPPSGQPGTFGHIWSEENLNVPRFIAASIQKLGSPSVLAIIKACVQKVSTSGRFACCAVRVQSADDKSWSELQVLVPFCLIWEKSPSPQALFEALFSAEGRKSGSLCCTANALIPDAKSSLTIAQVPHKLTGLLLHQAAHHFELRG
ncbi:hypothetical protein WJX84_008291 [Apatococcus fuscideae]|uniref:Uncharacterized protein n=1 Tax=Apatococcus fuscideae TaxID=2026836 RepID=A0AAW1SU59_9CHLO